MVSLISLLHCEFFDFPDIIYASHGDRFPTMIHARLRVQVSPCWPEGEPHSSPAGPPADGKTPFGGWWLNQPSHLKKYASKMGSSSPN